MTYSLLIFAMFSVTFAFLMRFVFLTFRPVFQDLGAALREAMREYRRRRLVRLKCAALRDPFTTN